MPSVPPEPGAGGLATWTGTPPVRAPGGDGRGLGPGGRDHGPAHHRTDPRRAVPDAGDAGPRGDGGGLAGLRPEAAGGRGLEVRPDRAAVQREGPRAVAAGGASGARGRLSERLPDLRPGPGRGAGAGVDGVHRRGDAHGDPAEAGPAGAPGGSGDRVAVSLGPRGHPPGGSGASGLQAGERDADPGGPGGGDGLRPGQGPGRDEDRHRSRARRRTWPRSRPGGRRWTPERTCSPPGVVLAEMLAVGGEGGLEARRTLWKAIAGGPAAGAGGALGARSWRRRCARDPRTARLRPGRWPTPSRR